MPHLQQSPPWLSDEHNYIRTEADLNVQISPQRQNIIVISIIDDKFSITGKDEDTINEFKNILTNSIISPTSSQLSDSWISDPTAIHNFYSHPAASAH